ncbi:MAG: gluconokinase [Ferruginibacter sp.]
MQHKVIFIMGVSGSGKTTIGEALSARTGFEFYDADNFHTPESIAKMKAGIPLTDGDRWPWLYNIHEFAKEKIKTRSIITVCSALKQVYRDILSKGIEDNCKWIFLSGDYDTILSRLQKRTGHYMPPTLLQSQFDTLEIPSNAIGIDIHQTPEEIIDDIISRIGDVVQ